MNDDVFYKEGYNSNCNGISYEENPYYYDNEEYNAWACGWLTADNECVHYEYVYYI